MPLVFQVLRCYKCSVFQVHQTKKSNKFICKLCGEKQSIKRHYGIGTAKECRLHVQKLNGIRKEIDELNSTVSDSPSEEEVENEPPCVKKPEKSKWSSFVKQNDEPEDDPSEKMYLGDQEVCLELPKKKPRKHNIKKINNVVIEHEDIADITRNKNSINSIIKAIEDTPNFDKISQNPFDKYENTKCSNNKPASSIKVFSKNTNNFNKCLDSPKKLKPEGTVAKSKDIPKNLNKASNSSKWAQYIDEEEDPAEHDSSIDSNCSLNEQCTEQVVGTKTLFFLCEDNDLDNILNI